MPKISVIIPVYNVERYLRKCLDSVLAQTLADMEVICVNDGSTDGSRTILTEYGARDSRIRIVDRENGGLSEARNSGVAVAAGKYIYFADSDDWLEPDAMQTCFDLAEKNGLDEVIFECVPEFETKELKSVFAFEPSGKTYAGSIVCGEELFVQMERNHDRIACAWLRFLKRDFYSLNKLSFYPGILHEDELFSFRCDLSSKRAMYLQKKLYHYRIRNNSIMTAKNSFRHFAGLGITYLESAKFLFAHPVSNEETRKAVAIQKDRWLYAASKLMEQIPQEEMRDGCRSMPEMIQFVEMVRLYDRMMETEYRREIQEEKMDAVLHSGSYKLGHAIGKCLHPFRKEN